MPTASFAAKREHRQEHEQSDGTMLYLSPLAPGETLTSADLYPINYEFTTVGDMSVNVRLASLLTSQHHSFDVRAGENISIGDLRESPSVLVGGYNNFLTLKLSHDLPFVLDGSEDGRQPIQESGGTKRGWSSQARCQSSQRGRLCDRRQATQFRDRQSCDHHCRGYLLRHSRRRTIRYNCGSVSTRLQRPPRKTGLARI